MTRWGALTGHAPTAKLGDTDSRQPDHRDCQGIREEMDHGSDIPMDADISALVTAGQEGERSHGKQRGNKIVLRAPSIQLSKDYCCGITLRKF